MKYSSCITNPSIFEQPLNTILETLIKAGFDGIDIPGDENLYPVAKIKPLLDSYKNKLPIAEITACMNPTRDLIHPDPAKRKIATDYIKYCIDTAVQLECLQTHMCFLSFPENLAQNPREKLEQLGIAAIRDCADYAHEKGVRLLLEPLFKDDVSLVNRADQAVSLFARAMHMEESAFITGNHDFGLLLDLFHMHHEEQDLAVALEKYRKITYHVHVADHPRGLDFSRTDSGFVRTGIQKLQQLNYSGYISFESFNPAFNLEQLPKSLAMLKKLEKH
jgi:D-psicose/D-tagatose/L-ribulose 3-epimerase